jgi:hypothetical protein
MRNWEKVFDVLLKLLQAIADAVTIYPALDLVLELLRRWLGF